MSGAIHFPELTVVVVTYQSQTITPHIAQTLANYANVTIVDNASSDGTADTLARLLPHATLIRNTTNVGFGAANNQGVALATTTYVLLLNPDCTLPLEATQALLDAAAQYPNAGIIAPQPLRPSGEPQGIFGRAFYHSYKAAPYAIPEGICCGERIAGCCWLMPTATYRAVGGFDEAFFLYYEDDDFCLRMLQAGHDCLVQPAALVCHVGGGGSRPDWRIDLLKFHYYARSRQRMMYKYGPLGSALSFQCKTLLGALFGIPVFSLLLRKKYLVKWLAWGSAMLTPEAWRLSFSKRNH